MSAYGQERTSLTLSPNLKTNHLTCFGKSENSMKKIAALVTLCAFVLFVQGCSQRSKHQEDAKENFVYIHESIPNIVLDVRYFSEDNFMGTRVDGYHKAVILVSKGTSQALSEVQKKLNQQGLGLKIFDAYRPQKAVDHFVRWTKDPADTVTKKKYYPNHRKDRLIELGYIAEKSGHTRGSTLDLTVVDLETGEELDMGSPWDFFGEISHHDSSLVDEEANANRNLLRDVMIKHGFEPFPERYFDFDVE
jgi:D-alanyl-D-alanine dipeptidase